MSEVSLAKLQKDLSKKNLALKSYQVVGVERMISWISNGHGGILADEMGLGKTCEAIMLMNYLVGLYKDYKFLVICPLSVLDHWEREIKRFGSKKLRPFVYYANKDERKLLHRDVKDEKYNVLITSYFVYQNDTSFLKNYHSSDVLLVDEGHSLKDSSNLVYKNVLAHAARFVIILTGTPVQNNLRELYTMLSVVDANKFPRNEASQEAWLRGEKSEVFQRSKDAVSRYVVRRLKNTACSDLPSCSEVLLSYRLTKLQRDMYNAVLVNNHQFFEDNYKTGKHSLMGSLMQLMKVVSHPYLFPKVEPEPFTEGEHVIKASAKFIIIDRLVHFLRARKHKVIIFSYLKICLDIVSDCLTFRGIKHFLLDGRTKQAERKADIDAFQDPNSDVDVFLISTKAGGLGITLTAADTVIFADNGLNPQDDLQAAARCHRIGQDKPVKVIRFIAECTVDKKIYERAQEKLKLSTYVLEDDLLALPSKDLTSLLLSDLEELNSDDSEPDFSYMTDEFFTSTIGETDPSTHRWKHASDVVTEAAVVIEDEVHLEVGPVIERTKELNQLRVLNSIKEFEHVQLLAKRLRNGATKDINDTEAEVEELQERLCRNHENMARERVDRSIRLERRKEELEAKRARAGYISRKLMPPINEKPTVAARGPGRIIKATGNVASPARDASDTATDAWILFTIPTSVFLPKSSLLDAARSLIPDLEDQCQELRRMQDVKRSDVHLFENVSAQQSESMVATDNRNISVALLFITGKLKREHLRECFQRVASNSKLQDRNVLPSIHLPALWWRQEVTGEEFHELVRTELIDKGFTVYYYRFDRFASSMSSHVVARRPFSNSQSSNVGPADNSSMASSSGDARKRPLDSSALIDLTTSDDESPAKRLIVLP